MAQTQLPVFQNPAGGVSIRKDDHVRICEALQLTADALGTGASMRAALHTGRPAAGGAESARLHFGDELAIVAELLKPLLQSLDQMIPGFFTWLVLTKFGDDRDMIKALLDMSNRLAALPKPTDARQRPAGLKLPRFH